MSATPNRKRMLTACLGVFAAALISAAAANAAELPPACRAKIDTRVSAWRLITPSADVAAWAREMNEGPVYRIAVCMTRTAGPELHIIDEPYCRDGLMIAKKGTRAYNFDTDQYVTYRTDGLHAYCFEKAGATYLYRNGRFIRIIDSD